MEPRLYVKLGLYCDRLSNCVSVTTMNERKHAPAGLSPIITLSTSAAAAAIVLFLIFIIATVAVKKCRVAGKFIRFFLYGHFNTPSVLSVPRSLLYAEMPLINTYA